MPSSMSVSAISKSAISRRLFSIDSPPSSNLRIGAIHSFASPRPAPCVTPTRFMSASLMPARLAASRVTVDVAPVSNNTLTSLPFSFPIDLMAGNFVVSSRRSANSDTGVCPAQ